MYANLCDYFYVKKKTSEIAPSIELQLCAEHNV